MNTLDTLTSLIAQAYALAGARPCESHGHAWKTDGGRACPRDCGINCSQTVYVCDRCGEQDYGEPGGPAHRECFIACAHESLDLEDDS